MKYRITVPSLVVLVGILIWRYAQLRTADREKVVRAPDRELVGIEKDQAPSPSGDWEVVTVPSRDQKNSITAIPPKNSTRVEEREKKLEEQRYLLKVAAGYKELGDFENALQKLREIRAAETMQIAEVRDALFAEVEQLNWEYQTKILTNSERPNKTLNPTSDPIRAE